MRRPIWLLGIILAALGTGAVVQPRLVAQDIPDEFENLMLLDENISKDDLKATMKGFTEQLGVKCTFCHDLDSYASDEKEHKRIARGMIRLVQHMQENTLEYFKEGTEPNQTGCWTCHRGEAEIEGFAPEDEDEDWL